MKEFMLFDYYEDYGHIGDYDTEEEARKAWDEWREETDGECNVVLSAYCKETGGYEEIDGDYNWEE